MRRKKKTKKRLPLIGSQAEKKYFRIDVEFLLPNSDKFKYLQFVEAEESAAQKVVELMKRCGIGGRLFYLDGSPGGTHVDTWGSVERVASCEKLERAALKYHLTS
jgi:hypothetical protein